MTEPGGLYIELNPDGTVNRPMNIPLLPPTGEDQPRNSVFSKDVPLNPTLKTWLRIFRPVASKTSKLPIIIYFHGGGFALFSVATAPFNELCATMARELPAIVISLEYRLAPENPLPSAYEDAVQTIEWIKKQAIDCNSDQWLRDYADFSRCFLMGSSSGANIAYHAALKVCDFDLKPLNIAGLILDQPYFGGIERTESELRFMDDRILPLTINDLMWKLALPGGADRDHEFSNPMKKGEVGFPLQRCMVRMHGQDPLLDRQREFIRMLGRCRVEVMTHFYEDGYHAVEVFDQVKARALLMDVHHFIDQPIQLADSARAQLM